MGQAAPSFTFSKTKPTWLLVRSDKKPGGDMDATFDKVRANFGSKIDFKKLNWEDKKAESVIDRFSLKEAPSSVITDSKGRVVEKFEGTQDASTITQKLSKVIEGKKEK